MPWLCQLCDTCIVNVVISCQTSNSMTFDVILIFFKMTIYTWLAFKTLEEKLQKWGVLKNQRLQYIWWLSTNSLLKTVVQQNQSLLNNIFSKGIADSLSDEALNHSYMEALSDVHYCEDTRRDSSCPHWPSSAAAPGVVQQGHLWKEARMGRSFCRIQGSAIAWGRKTPVPTGFTVLELDRVLRPPAFGLLGLILFTHWRIHWPVLPYSRTNYSPG